MALPKHWETMKQMGLEVDGIERTFEGLGMACARRNHHSNAIAFFDDVLKQNKKRSSTYTNRSKSHTQLAQMKKALEDAEIACGIEPKGLHEDLLFCDAKYDMCDYEKNKIEVANRSRPYVGVDLQRFESRMNIIDCNIMEMIGEKAGECLNEQRGVLERAYCDLHKDDNPVKRPFWKILRDQKKCDVLSIRDKDEDNTNPREVARRKLKYRIFMQTYFDLGWRDCAFFKTLLNDKSYILSQTPVSNVSLKKLATAENARINTFAHMLHSRCPLYTKTKIQYPVAADGERRTEEHLYSIQYQTRRDAFEILEKVHKLREDGDIRVLADFVEMKMDKYFSVKTFRVMPRKFEFLNEIYNIVALSYCDKFKIPDDLDQVPEDNRMFALFSIKPESEDDEVYVLDELEYVNQNEPDYEYLAYKARVHHFDLRLEHAQYPIEKCFIYHEISQLHLTQWKVDDVKMISVKQISEAVSAGHFVYMFLAFMAMLKGYTHQRNLTKIRDYLKITVEVLPHLENPDLDAFVNKCIEANQRAVENYARLHRVSIIENGD